MATIPLQLDPNNPLLRLAQITPGATPGFGDAFGQPKMGLQRIAATPTAPTPVAAPSMPVDPSALAGKPQAPDLGQPALPNAMLDPSAPLARLGRDQSELTRLQKSGPGVNQIANPVDASGNPTGEHQGLGWKLLSGLGHAADIGLSAVAPGLAMIAPGTTLHNLVLQKQERNRIGEDQGEAQKAAQLGQEQAQAGLLNTEAQYKPVQLQNAAALNAAKIDHLGAQDQHYEDQTEQQLAQHGYKHDDKGNITPMAYAELSPQLQAIEDLKHAQTEQADATAALKKAQNDPSSPAYRLAQQRVAVAGENARTAMGRLSLAGQSLGMRREMMDANLYGTGPNGQPLPGAPQLEDENGNMQTVGLRAGGLAVKQQGKVTAFNDLQGSAAHARQALQSLHDAGGSLSDPTVIAAMHDPTSLTGKWVNGTFVKPNLSPQQVQAIGALNQLREQIGIMRSTTGGPAAEAQAQRMLSALPDAGDAKNTAVNKMDELDGVITRLRPGAVHVAGGMAVQGQPKQAPAGTQTFTENGTVYHIPANMVSDFKKDHPNAR
jgi:hypothetical protein